MIQLATKADRAAVNALAAQVHAMHVAWRPDIFCPVDELYSEEEFLHCIRLRQLYVAKIGDAVIGYTLVRMEYVEGPGVVPQKRMFIDEFCVQESCRGQGFGTEMVMEIRVLAKAFRCTDLQLGVFPQNDAAVGFWQKCGFTIRSIEMQRKV